MNQDQLREAIIKASEIVKQDDVYIIGSQSILGSYSEDVLPKAATFSSELDVLPVRDSMDMLANKLDAEAGWGSDFHLQHGYYLDGVNDRTAVLPTGWQKRLVPVEARKHPRSTGWCLEPHDACVAKLFANREKDLEFVNALLKDGFVNALTLKRRIANVPSDRINREDRKRMRRFAESYLQQPAANTLPLLGPAAQEDAASSGKIWVRDHERLGKPVAGHWRLSKR